MLNRLLNLLTASSLQHDDYQDRFHTDVFFRTRDGFLKEAELPTKHEDVPDGVPLFHYFAYKFAAPWFIETLLLGVYGGIQTATFCRSGEHYIEAYFSTFDDGWFMNFSKLKSTDDWAFREFLSLVVRFLAEMDAVYDVRWYNHQFLTCGCLHDGEFEKGKLSPFVSDADPTGR